jgi:hypothetical protein
VLSIRVDAGIFERALRAEFGRVQRDVGRAQAEVTELIADTMHLNAAVDTGRMKGNIRCFRGSPDTTFDESRRDTSRGALRSPEQQARDEAALKPTVAGDVTGVIAAAPYSSYVDQGTERMAAQPMTAPALAAAERYIRR